MRIRRTRNHVRRRGVAAVEMALVLPIFVIVVLGIIEFGRAMMVGQLLTNAARSGARLAILDGTTNSDVTTAVKDFVRDTVNVPDTAIDVQITITPAPGNPDPFNNLSAAEPRDLCRVQVQVAFDDAALLVGNYMAGLDLTGIASMRHE